MRTSRPSIAELRAATQPPSIFERNSGEHWAGRLYVRRLSPYLTRLLLRTPITPNGVTWLMIAERASRAAARADAGRRVLAAIGACLLIQLQILLDCSDGELARWRGAVLAGRHLPRPLRPLGHRGRPADRARASASTSRSSASSSPCSCCSSRARRRSCTSRGPRPGSARWRTRVAVAAPARRGARAAAALRRPPAVLPRVRGDRVHDARARRRRCSTSSASC